MKTRDLFSPANMAPRNSPYPKRTSQLSFSLRFLCPLSLSLACVTFFPLLCLPLSDTPLTSLRERRRARPGRRGGRSRCWRGTCSPSWRRGALTSNNACEGGKAGGRRFEVGKGVGGGRRTGAVAGEGRGRVSV